MSSFENYPLSEFYRTTVPPPPGQIDWKLVAVYGTIGLSSVIIFGVIIHYSQKSMMKKWIVHTEKMNEAFIAALAARGEALAKATAPPTVNENES